MPLPLPLPGRPHQVVQQGSAFLKGKGKAPQAGRKGSPSAGNASSTADVALCVAWAHAALALDPGPASVEARYEHCTSALELLERCQVAAPQMTAQLQEIKEVGAACSICARALPSPWLSIVRVEHDHSEDEAGRRQGGGHGLRGLRRGWYDRAMMIRG